MIFFVGRLCAVRFIPWLSLFALSSMSVMAQEAEIVSLVGQGETRSLVQADWAPAAVKQILGQGTFVRTREASQMALLLKDRTQLRLSQNSMVQIKEVAASGETTKLEMGQGRIWAQAKRKVVADPSQPPAVTVQMPNAIAAIRGTDWEIAVDKDGAATLTVLSGEVAFSNQWGRVLVGPKEQARVEAGRAPTKRLLVDARERVQWVTAYRPQPRRWLPADSGGLEPVVEAIENGNLGDAIAALEARRSEEDSDLLLADIYLSLGRAGEAIALLKAYPSRPRAAALLGRAYLVAGRPSEAAQVLAQAAASHPRDAEVLLARGDLLRFNGDPDGARETYRKVLAGQAANADAWFGLGRIDAEREAVRPGREELGRAIGLNPAGAGYQGELATLETFANEFGAAEQAFSNALAQQPDDYVALTGLGILRLKQGQPEAALEALLKAGVIEPRYARGALYTGVAYYQLDSQVRAREMFARAAELDPRDPLPHMMQSLVAADRMELGEAVAAARRASELMPYLKSLNQLLNDQKGNANLGASLARFGLEEWAQAYAYNAYTPYWAGSHLFLADRFAGDFNKNSELFLGFLTDPTVFGASNRFNTLIASPGHYASIAGLWSKEDSKGSAANFTANGYSVAAVPFAYFASAEPLDVRPRTADVRGRGNKYTVGLGARPSDEIGLFLFADSYDIDADMVQAGSMPMAIRMSDDNRRLDLGGGYKLSPASQLWLKAGSGKDDTRVGGSAVMTEAAGALNQLLDSLLRFRFCTAIRGGCYSPTAGITRYATSADQSDLQFRHTFDAGSAWQVSWGVEKAEQDKPLATSLHFPALIRLPAIGLGMQAKDKIESTEIFFSNRIRLLENLRLQADISHVELDKRYASELDFSFQGSPRSFPIACTNEVRKVSEWNPRLGLAWNPAAGQTLRLAAQQWRRPAAVNTMAPLDTAGISVDDRLVAMGGDMKRVRGQYEWEMDSQTFVQGFVDRKTVRNLTNAANVLVPDFNLEDLKRLASRRQIYPAMEDFWEAAPEFGEARADTVGLALNRVLTASLSANLRYYNNRSRNIGSGYEGLSVPWLPRHYFSAGANWLPAPRWQLAFGASYRSGRYRDEANTDFLRAGWNFNLRSYWESPDKRWSFEAVAANLHSDKSSAATASAVLGAQALYRF